MVSVCECHVQDLLEFLRQRTGQCGLIYAVKRESCTSLAHSLRCCSPYCRYNLFVVLITLLPVPCMCSESRKAKMKCELVFHTCSCAGINIVAYHAGMDDASRARLQDNWKQGHIAVLIATIAFGL